MSEDWQQLNRKYSMSHYIDLTATYSSFVIGRGLDFVSTTCKHKNTTTNQFHSSEREYGYVTK